MERVTGAEQLAPRSLDPKECPMKLPHLAHCAAGRVFIAVGLMAGVPTVAAAQAGVDQTSTNVPGVKVIAAPPAGFNPVTGTPRANAQFATPPAPDARTALGAHTAWQNAVTATQKRETPVLTPTNIFNGPMQGKD